VSRQPGTPRMLEMFADPSNYEVNLSSPAPRG
jgi:hypothetical protein